MKLLSMLLVLVSGFAVSCERHEFEGPDGTKQIHTHGAHGAHAEESKDAKH
jgi:hypothetical protein